MQYAQIEDGKVVNIVAADAEWVAEQSGEFVEFSDEQPAFIGFGYDPETGFEQPPPFITPAV